MLPASDADQASEAIALRRLTDFFPALAAPDHSGSGVDLLLTHVRLLRRGARTAAADTVAITGRRITAVGTLEALSKRADARTRVIDGGGGLAIPAFHDAHLHLLSWARARRKVDCRPARSLAELASLLSARATVQAAGTWVRGVGADARALQEQRLPDRQELDRALPAHPVRLQDRGLHLDVLNTAALRALDLFECLNPAVERDSSTGQPTGRLYHAGELLRSRFPRAPEGELATDIRAATQQLLAWGVTTIQDASSTNGAPEWELFHRLADHGALHVRAFLLPGLAHWREVGPARPRSDRVRLGPVKVMLEEGTSRLDELGKEVQAVQAAGRSLALHVATESELVLALALLRDRRQAADAPDRLEHAAVIPDALLADVREAGVTVVGQPSLVRQRGDVYRTEYPVDQQGWLHRARSLIEAGVPYAIGSDGPVTEPIPLAALQAAQSRRTLNGAVLGPSERLTFEQAVQALTLGPAQSLGAAGRLGAIRAGSLADLVVLDPRMEQVVASADPEFTTRLTIMGGQVVWERPRNAHA